MFKEEKIPGLIKIVQSNILLMEEILHSLEECNRDSGERQPSGKLSLDDPFLEMSLITPPNGGAYLPIGNALPPVPMASTYWMGKYPVTGRLWKAVMGTSPSRGGGGDDAPVDSVTWDEANTFCEKLSSIFGFDGATRERAPFRLPTEAEWEWAASGGVRVEQAVTNETGWYEANGGGRSHPVGEKKPNEWGLHDMLGNVWEWTSSEDGAFRVPRGGSWLDDPRFARVAYRGWFVPGNRYGILGFRLARG